MITKDYVTPISRIPVNPVCFGFALLFLIFQSIQSFGQSHQPGTNKIWTRPVIIPAPSMVSGVKYPVVSLNGRWKLRTDPEKDFWNKEGDGSLWKTVEAPGQIDFQGIRIPAGKPYAYSKELNIPADYKGQRIFIRFEGVSGVAKAYINGHFLKAHFGGFNIWTCDITDYVGAGAKARLVVSVTEHTTEQSTAPGFDRGGILRNVKLMAVPRNHLYRLNVETDLDEQYKNAVMRVWVGVRSSDSKVKPTLNFNLRDPDGKAVPMKVPSFKLSGDLPETIIDIPVINPAKWDAEHPELYTLEVQVMSGNKVMETVSKKIGFREIKVVGTRMLVNGKEIKLRGAGRFDSDPVYGRYLSDSASLKEVRMLKDANLNFVRPSCYPATEAYLDACDRLGLYVQLENTVTFTKGSQHDTASTHNYLNLIGEMIEANRSHPAVIIYELANETYYGINIGKTYQYAKAEDASRPVIYSWSQSVPPGVPWPYEIFSVHYPDWDTDLGIPSVSVFNSRQARPLPQGMPVLHDEFAHGASYYQASLSRDPGMRDFWGISLKKFWERMFLTDGCLGGAMWAMLDDNAAGAWVYEWGAIDLWRRERPEYWHFRKAYSPIRVNEKDTLALPQAGKSLLIPVKNWYDHTNFNELTIQWTAGGRSGKIKGPDILPHGNGTISLPGGPWKNSEVIHLSIYDRYNRLIDEFRLSTSSPKMFRPVPSGGIPEIRKTNAGLVITGKNFEILFDALTGLISSGKLQGKEIIKGGPYFHLTGGKIGEWKLKNISAQAADKNEVEVTIEGSYDSVGVVFELSIDGTGMIKTEYTLNNFRLHASTPRKIPWDKQDAGGFEEVGVSYLLTGDVDRLSWKRKGLWSVYPNDHIGRNEGIAYRYGTKNTKIFGQRPQGKWYQDELDFVVFGKYDLGKRGTNDFRSTKENIYQALAFAGSQGVGVQVNANAESAVRMEVDQDYSGWVDNNNNAIRYSGNWVSAMDTLDYFGQPEKRSTGAAAYVEYSFDGTGIAWIGTRSITSATAEVFIDDKLEATDLVLSNRAGVSPQAVLYSITGLKKGAHNIKIKAKEFSAGGTGSPNTALRRTGIPLDAFIVLNDHLPEDVRLIINNKWNHSKMSLGNFTKEPVLIGSQFRGNVTIRLTDVDHAIE